IHYVKALASQLNIEIGNNHGDIRSNIKPADSTNRRPKMAFTKGAYGLYDYLYKASQASRYNGFVDNNGSFTDEKTYEAIMAREHEVCCDALNKFKSYIIDTRKLK